jgi:hypothetical protein
MEENVTMQKPDIFDAALDSFKASMEWSKYSTETERELVYGNLNGFVAHLRSRLSEPSPEMLAAGRRAWEETFPAICIEELSDTIFKAMLKAAAITSSSTP